MEVALRVEDGRTVCERCVLADTALARMRGLLGRKMLPPGEGILLRPASSVHTAFMRFPIDVVFLDRENRIVRIAENVRPWRTAAARKARTVVELAAGQAERRGLQLGDRVIDVRSAPRRPRTPFKKLPWRFGTNLFLALLWLGFASANFLDWRVTHRPVGLGATLFEAMGAFFFVIRRKPWVTATAPLAWTATTIGTWGMLAARPSYEPLFGAEAVYFSIQLLGVVGAALSLGVLGRSFGLVAANRGIRTKGPYGVIRHPLYASYFITDLGYTLENPSTWNALVFVLVMSFQVVRIRTEEDFLREDPHYVRYCAQVPYRLVPRLW
ncbi:MAG TPA: DUF192 domain-containing protein [Gaiellaceae bacterium]|nr:DUF192 domain-containing protein [Gaiellaceae bacterium]